MKKPIKMLVMFPADGDDTKDIKTNLDSKVETTLIADAINYLN